MQENINIPDSTITTNLSFRQLVLMNMQQLTNFPYIEKDFDALTDYELLCLVVKFLNDVIANQNEQNASITRMYESFLALQEYVNNTKDELEDAFNNLDNYVRNYFDNLDVQDEINNKLNQMLEDGVLEQIIEQFLQTTALWCFDTVASMKQATNLTNGSYARTLGYYSINDDGGTTYKITSTESQDEYQEVLNNGLYATLINNDVINVKQFGAKGDGINDDTQAIQNAINYCKKSISNNMTGNSVISISGGKYLITDTIVTYPYVRLKTIGTVIMTTTINKELIKLDATNDNLPLVEYNLATLIDGSEGLRLENTNVNATNSIGINVVNYRSTNRKTCNFTMKSIALSGFNIGVKLSTYNIYIIKFEELSNSCTIGVQFGDAENHEQYNSGENIVFSRCVFVNPTAIRYYTAAIDCNFNNCSFDYCGVLFEDMNKGGYRKIFVNGGHIEDVKTAIVNKEMPYSTLIITGCKLINKNNVNLFGDSYLLDIIIKNNDITYLDDPTQNPTNNYIVHSNGTIMEDNKMGYAAIAKPIRFGSLVPHHTFDNATVGTITYARGEKIGSYKMEENLNVGSIECIDTNIFGSGKTGKIIKITKNDNSNDCYQVLYSDFIPVSAFNRYRMYVCGKNCFASSVGLINFYDLDKNYVSHNDSYYYNSQEKTDGDDYVITKHYTSFTVPQNATYIKVGYYFGNNNRSISTFEIAGIFLEKY